MVVCWSGNYIAAKLVFREIPAEIVIGVRTVIAGLLMVPIWWRDSKSKAVVWDRREIGLLAGLGVGGIAMQQMFWTLGVARTTVVHSSMIMATTPLWVLLIARMVGIERITAPKLGGMAIAISGVALLQVYRTATPGQEATFLGDFMVLICALALAGMTAVGKRHKPQSGGIGIIAAGYIGGAVLLFPVLVWAGRGFDFGHVSWRAWAAIFYMGVFSSVTGYLIYLYALARISASRIATFQYLQPLFAILMAVAALGEHLSVAAMVSGGIIFAGVYVTERYG